MGKNRFFTGDDRASSLQYSQIVRQVLMGLFTARQRNVGNSVFVYVFVEIVDCIYLFSFYIEYTLASDYKLDFYISFNQYCV